MATTLSNRLNGPVTTVPDATSLAASGDPVGITSAADSAVYDDTHTLLGLSTIRVRSRPTRHTTARIDFAMPSGSWFVRFYAWTPLMSTTGVQRMVLFRIGGVNFTFLPTGAGNVSMRAYDQDDLGVSEIVPTLTGSAIAADQWIRWELEYDAGDEALIVRCYPGHSTSGARVFTYTNMDLGGQTVQLLTGYRFRRRWLSWNETSAFVEEYQNKLLDLGYDLPVFGADGNYGQETANAFEEFQGDMGLPVGAGEAENGVGPEDLSALDQRHSEEEFSQDFFSERPWISHLEVNDSQAPGPADNPFSPAFGEFDVTGQAAGVRRALGSGEGVQTFTAEAAGAVVRIGQAEGAAEFAGTASGGKETLAVVEGTAQFNGQAAGFKTALPQVEGTIVFNGLTEGEDTTGGVANDVFHVVGNVEHTVAKAGTATADAQFQGTASGTKSAFAQVATEVEYAPFVEQQTSHVGSASGTAEFTGQAAGIKRGIGHASDTFEVGGEAAGHATQFGAAEGLVQFLDGGAGVAHRFGSSEQEVTFTGQASGTKTTTGQATGEFIVSGAVSGTSETIIPDIVRVGLRYRLIAYAPNGQRIGQLPMPLSFQIGVPHNDMPSLALEYSLHAPGAQLLDQPCEVAVEFAAQDEGNYVEYPGCRFLRLRNQTDTTDRTGVVRYTMPNYAWMLRKVRNINTAAFNEEGERQFGAATPGQIIRAFIIEAQARGNVPGLEIDFTNTVDSAGQPWAMNLTIAFSAGQDLWSILDALSVQGAFDWRVHRRVLQLYNTDTALNQNLISDVVLHRQRDVTEAPDDSSVEDLASRVFVVGDQAFRTENNPSALTPWGQWEDSIGQSGVSDQGTMAVLAQARLERTANQRVQMTRQIAFPTTLYLPFIHYQPGDRITAPGLGGVQDELRVRQITVKSLEPHALDGALVLNDRFIERELRRDRQIAALTGGTSGQPGGGGGSPGEDTRSPAAPGGFVLDTDTFIDNMGEARGQITAGWLPVTTATDGTEMDIRRYEVWVRRAVAGEPFYLHTVVDHPDTVAFMSPFEIEQLYQVRVRAVGRNERRGPFTATQGIVPERDDVPPPAPSSPVLSTRLGVIQAAWDGLTNLGTAMPLDFDHVRVFIADDPTGPFEHIDTLYRAGSSVIPNQPYDEERFIYFTAVDRSGNESDPSTTENIATSQLVSTDVSPGSIGYELLEEGAVRDDILADDAVRNRHIAAGQITGDKIRAYSITADRIAVGNTKNLVTDPSFLNDELFDHRRDITTAVSGGTWMRLIGTERNGVGLLFSSGDGTYRYYLIQSMEAEGINDPESGFLVDEDQGRLIFRANGTTTGQTGGTTVEVAGFVRFLDRNGDLLGQPATTGTVTWTTGTEQEIISSNGAAIPDGAISALVYVRIILTGFAPEAPGAFFLTRPFSATTNGQVLIEDGAISANKIQANAITADKIQAGSVEAVHIQANAIQTDQLAANAITAKHTITGATIQTTATANRGVKITSTGLFAWDSNGNQTFSVSAATGNVITTGTYQSGLAGQNRILISPSANYLNQPGLRMFSGSSGARDSSLFIDSGSGEGGWDPWTVVLTGSEVTRNSSGRTDLILRHGNGGGGALRYQFGSFGPIGLDYDSWNMNLRGRITSGQGAYDYIVWGQSSTTGSGVTNWTFTYGTSAPNGDRLANMTGHGNNTLSRVVTANVTTQNPGNLFAVSSSDATHRVQYTAIWVDQNI